VLGFLKDLVLFKGWFEQDLDVIGLVHQRQHCSKLYRL